MENQKNGQDRPPSAVIIINERMGSCTYYIYELNEL